MASLKIFSLAVRTLAKPISASIKERAKNHPSFRNATIGLAQILHRTDMRMRMGLLGESKKTVRPLNDAKAIETGANFIAESFLFGVGLALILAEGFRSRRSSANRRDVVDDKLEGLTSQISQLQSQLKSYQSNTDDIIQSITSKDAEVARLVETIIDIGLRGGWMQRAIEGEDVEKRARTLSIDMREISQKAQLGLEPFEGDPSGAPETQTPS